MQRTLFAIILLAVVTLFMGACSDQPGDPQTPPVVETVAPAPDPAAASLRIGWTGSPDTRNPGIATSRGAFTLFDLIYDSLYQLHLDGAITPELVTDVAVSDDRTRWTFTIRDDVTWHDGEPLTAGDVAYSLQRYMTTPSFSTLHSYTVFFASVAATDDTTVVLTLDEAIPGLESRLLYLYVLPQHIWGQLQGEALLRFENEAMIGSGPFQLLDYRQGEAIQLAANSIYHGGAPNIAGLILQTFATPAAAVQALRGGEVDMITEVAKESVPALHLAAEEIAVVTGPPALSVLIGPPYEPAVQTIFFNQTAPDACPPPVGQCTGHPALRDRTMRLALAHATDKEQLVAGALHGFGAPGLNLISPTMDVWFNDSLIDHAYDPALANRLLEEAGYVDSDGNGVREMPDGGEPLVFRLNWPGDSVWAPRAADLLSEMWREIGVVVVPNPLDLAALQASCCPAFDYDIILWAWGSDPDPHFLLSLMTSDQIPNGMNETGYANPAYDVLFAQQAATLDATARQEIVWEMQRMVHDDVVYLIPFYRHVVQAYRTDRFTGWVTDAPMLDLAHVSSLLAVEPVE